MTDEAAQRRAHEIFDPIAEPLLARDGVDIGPMFGSEGLRIRGKVFAFVGRAGDLVVKLPAARIDELERAGTGTRMLMRGSPMREWATVGPDASTHWAPLTAEALDFVDGITA